MMKMLGSLAAVLCLLGFGFALDAQDEQPQQTKEYYYRIETNRVAIPVYVTDSDGNPIRDLSAENFRVQEGRSDCRITDVEFIDHLNPASRLYEITPPESRRQFLLIFDLSFSNIAGIRASRAAGIDFILEQTTPNDLIAVVTLSQRGGVKLLCPFSTSRSQALHSVAGLGMGDSLKYRDPAGFAFDSELSGIENEIDALAELESEISRGGNESDAVQNLGDILRMTENMDYSRYTGIVTRYVQVFESLATGLRSLHGRKNVIFFSEGFDQKALTGKSLDELEYDSQQMSQLSTANVSTIDSSGRFGSVALQRAFTGMLNEFNRGNSVFYVIDVGRLGAGDSDQQEVRSRGQNTLFSFADETNGLLYKNINNISTALADIAQRTSAGYLVVFEPSSHGKPGEFRKVRISVDRPNVAVNHQQGYYVEKAYRDFSQQEKMIQLSEFVSKDLVSQRIPFESDAQFFAGNEGWVQIPVFVEIDGNSILEIQGDRSEDSITVEIYGYLVDDMNKPVDFFHDILSFSTPEQKAMLKEKGIKYYGLLVGKSGRYKVKTIVRDAELGRISSRIQPVFVPFFSPDVLRISGPVFLDTSGHWMNMLMAAKTEPVGRREGQPCAYPYVWGENVWTPAINPEVDGTGKLLLYTKLYGLLLHPEQKIPQVSMRFEVVDESGNAKKMQSAYLVDRREDLESSVFELLFQIDFADQDLSPGQHQLRFIFTDDLSGNEITSEVPFIIPPI